MGSFRVLRSKSRRDRAPEPTRAAKRLAAPPTYWRDAGLFLQGTVIWRQMRGGYIQGSRRRASNPAVFEAVCQL